MELFQNSFYRIFTHTIFCHTIAFISDFCQVSFKSGNKLSSMSSIGYYAIAWKGYRSHRSASSATAEFLVRIEHQFAVNVIGPAAAAAAVTAAAYLVAGATRGQQRVCNILIKWNLKTVVARQELQEESCWSAAKSINTATVLFRSCILFCLDMPAVVVFAIIADYLAPIRRREHCGYSAADLVIDVLVRNVRSTWARCGLGSFVE